MVSTWIGVHLSLNQAAVESSGGDIKRRTYVCAHNTRTLNLIYIYKVFGNMNMGFGNMDLGILT